MMNHGIKLAPSLFDTLPPGAAPLQCALPPRREPDAMPGAAGVQQATVAQLAWREAGHIRSAVHELRERLACMPADAAWTEPLDRAHLAFAALMSALSDIQGASGEVARTEAAL